MTMTAEQLEKRRQIREEASRKASVIHDLMTSPSGEIFMEEFRSMFDKDVVAVENPHITTINAAQRDVVRWVEDVIRRGAPK